MENKIEIKKNVYGEEITGGTESSESFKLSSKVCSRCHERKSLSEFAKNHYAKNDRIVRRGYCKACKHERHKIPDHIMKKW